MNDLIEELAEVDRLAEKATPGPWLYRAKSNSWFGPPPEGSRYSYGDFIMGMGDDAEGTNDWDEPFLIAAVQFIRTHHATLTHILTDDAAIRAAHHDLVIRMGEVTTELEAARKDASILREALLKTTSVAVTQLFATHPDDVASVFPLSELQRISDVSAPLSAANVSVESIYLGAWVAAMKESGK